MEKLMKTKLYLLVLKKRTWPVLLVLLLLVVPAAVKAQFIYTTNADGVSLTITGYTGTGGAVTIPTTVGSLTVTAIGDDAFDGYSVTSVSIPPSITSIGDTAFEFCNSMGSITIPGSVTNIGTGAFASCAELTITVSSANSNYSSANGVLYNHNKTTLIQFPGGLMGSYTISNSVTSIGPDALFGCRLTTVTIPTSVTNIGTEAFSGCINLTTITVNTPNSHYSSQNGVLFSGTTLLQFPGGQTGYYYIPSGVANIGDYAFNGSFYLTSVEIASSVTNIGAEAFADCTELTTITVDTPNSYYSSENGVLFNASGTMLIQCPAQTSKSYTIPGNVITIGGFAFVGAHLTNITIPASVTSIGPHVFADCSALASVTIPGSVTNLGANAFGNCSALTSVTIPASVVSIGDDAFVFCTDLSSVYFEGDAPSFGSNVFAGDNSATAYYLSGTSAWSNPFAGLPAVLWNHSVQFSASPTNGTVSLTVQFTSPSMDSQGNTLTRWNWNFADGSTSTLQSPSHTFTNAGTFYASLFATNAGGVAVLGLGPSITTTFPTAQFTANPTNATAFQNVAFTSPSTDSQGRTITSRKWSFGDGSTSTLQSPSHTYTNAGIFQPSLIATNNLGFTVLGSGPSIIVNGNGYVAPFYYTASAGAATITSYVGSGGSVTIPATINALPITSVGQSAFESKTSLASVTIPSSVTSIGYATFQSCFNLTNVALTSGLSSIAAYAFYGCTGLTTVTIPASVTNIGPPAFGHCTSLTTITVDTNNSFYSSMNGVLFDTSQSILVEYPGVGGSYTIPASVTSIGAFAFYGWFALTNITIPSGVTNIGQAAFDFCPNLTNVALTIGLTSIGADAFNDCTGLTSVTVPASVTSIGTAAFGLCASLTTITVDTNNAFYSSANGVLFDVTQSTLVEYPGGLGGSYTIPSTVTNIGADAFVDCTGLTSVNIPASVASIGADAFADCPGLTNVYFTKGLISIGTAAFLSCTSLTTVTIPGSVTSIGSYAFEAGSGLTSVYFQGNAPAADSTAFAADTSATVYYLPGTTGWSNPFGGAPAVLWNPLIQTGDGIFGVQNNQFGFNVTGSTNLAIVVEACTDLANPVWVPLQTNTITNGSLYFSEPLQTNSLGRFYRISAQ